MGSIIILSKYFLSRSTSGLPLGYYCQDSMTTDIGWYDGQWSHNPRIYSAFTLETDKEFYIWSNTGGDGDSVVDTGLQILANFPNGILE